MMLRGGRIDEAQEQLSRNAESAVALGDPDITVDVLGLFSMLFAELGDAERSALLLGASEALRRKAELPLPEPDATYLARSVDKVRSQPTPDLWTANVERGAVMSVQEALAVALGAEGLATAERWRSGRRVGADRAVTAARPRRAVVVPVQQPHGHAVPFGGSRLRRQPRRGHPCGREHQGVLHLVVHHARVCPPGAGVARGPGSGLADPLGHGLHASLER